MSRRVEKRDCPPLIKEKWDLACQSGSRDEKGKIFALFLACGGDIGKMEVLESIQHRTTHSAAEGQGWFTRADLVAKYHGDTAVADDLIARLTRSAPHRIRPHPDFPMNESMKQYKAFSEASEKHEIAQDRVRSMNWVSNISGSLALELTENIERMLAICPPMDVLAVPAEQGRRGGKGGKGGGGKDKPPKAGGKPRPPKKAVDPIKEYTAAMATKSLEYSTAMIELRARLSEHTWTTGLVNMLDSEITAAQRLHDSFIKSSPDTLGPLVVEFRSRAVSAAQVIKAGDSMIGGKKRKLPVEPPVPDGVVVPPATAALPIGDAPAEPSAASPAAA
jgi:hypothetical protein